MNNQDFKQGLDESRNKFQQMDEMFTSAGTKLTAGLTTPLVGLGLASVSAASDLNESMSAVGTVFGDSAKNIHGYAGEVSDILGLSRQDALNYSATLGAIFTAAGVNADSIDDMSNKTLEMGADFASFYNTSPEDAVHALTAAYTGEYESLKKYGVILNEDIINQTALANGIWDGEGAMTQAQKTMATYLAIQERMGPVQGDFVRTSDGLANSQRILKAKFKDTIAQLGMQFLPLVLKLIQKLMALMEWFGKLSPEQKKWIVVIAAVLAALGPLLLILGAFAAALGAIIAIAPFVGTAFTIMLGPIGLVIALIALFVAAYATNFLGIRDITNSVVASIVSAFNTVVEWFSAGGIGRVLTYLKNWGARLIGYAKTALIFYITLPYQILKILWDVAKGLADWALGIIAQFSALPDSILSTLGIAFNILRNWGWDLIEGMISGILSNAGNLYNAVTGVIGNVVGGVDDLLDFGSPSKVIEQRGIWAIEGLNQGAQKTPVDLGLNPNGSAFMPSISGFSGGGGGGTTIYLAAGAIVVHSNDPEAAGDAVMRRLLAAADRVESGEAA